MVRTVNQPAIDGTLDVSSHLPSKTYDKIQINAEAYPQ